MQAVADLRKEYSASGLEEHEVPSEPMTLFRRWLDEAVAAKVVEPNAMCLSTVSADGKPSGRYVLLKGLDDRGFVWYTNYQSRKGQELAAAAFHVDGVDAPAAGPPACLTFWWGDLERSVRIEGTVERVAEAESQAYFNSRPRGSRIGAWASNQSRPIGSRAALEAQYEDVCARFGGEKEEDNEGQVQPVPKPEHWGGFRLVPERVEFWKGRQSRLHDRLAYALLQEEGKAGGRKWALERLQP
ncbi:pyridoxamine 5-phosphate oxidase [Nannochloropsis oceanica]